MTTSKRSAVGSLMGCGVISLIARVIESVIERLIKKVTALAFAQEKIAQQQIAIQALRPLMIHPSITC